MSDWPFSEPKNLAVITTRSITSGNAPILYVVHDIDGDWQFLDGGEVDMTDAMVVGLHHLTQIDPTFFSLADLPPGWEAWRATREINWQRRQIA